MNRQNDILKQYVHDNLYSTDIPALSSDDFDNEHKELAEAIIFLSQAAKEAFEMAKMISDGELETQVSNQNPLVHPLKNLQATLRHLTWQTKQIANGDYEQKVDFLGDFSKAFEVMVDQLKMREDLIRETAEKDRKTAESINNLLKGELQNQVNHYERLTQATHELRAYRHDMNNHFFCIESLLQTGKLEEAKNYIASLTKIINKKSNFLDTGNYVFDALVSEKIQNAKEKGIEIETKISIGRNLSIAPVDWCILFGNALDNAIEASEKVKDHPRIIFNVGSKGSFLSAKIENNYEEAPVMRGNRLLTSKKDDLQHGRGLQNIQETVERYDGTMDIAYQNATFTLTFLLCDVKSK